jgi:hypothetical protein
MPASLRPLSTGELLDKTFSLYRTNFPLFFGIAALPNLVLLIVQLTTNGLLRSAGQVQTTSAVAGRLLAGFLGLIVYLICAVIAASVNQAATIFAVSSLYLEEPTGIQAAYARVKGLIWRTVSVGISVGLRVGFGFLLFIIPGIIMLRRYSLSVPALVLERLKASAALKRSKQLSEGSGGRILLVYVLMLALIWGVSFGLLWLTRIIFTPQVLQRSFAAQAVQQFTSFLVAAAVGPVMTIAFSLLYYDQRVRKEAFDIEHMMTTLQAASGAPAAAAGASA